MGNVVAGDDPTTVAGAANDSRIGTILQDRYRILEPIADGGMGIVYRGERLTLGRPVAIKFLHKGLLTDPNVIKRFWIEAQAMSRVNHPNCVSVIDFGVAEGPYLVMDLVTGATLRELLREGPLPVDRALRIATHVLAGLAHAHGHGIVHRDIKPENIVVERTPGLPEHARILDFGIAKVIDSGNNITQGMALGTPNYMAPEQMGNGVVDARTDLYAVAMTFFEMLTGKPPFASPDLGEILRRHLQMPPPLLREVAPQAGYSAQLEVALLRAMAKSPESRYPTAVAMIAALEAVPESGQSVHAQPPPPDLSRRASLLLSQLRMRVLPTWHRAAAASAIRTRSLRTRLGRTRWAVALRPATERAIAPLRRMTRRQRTGLMTGVAGVAFVSLGVFLVADDDVVAPPPTAAVTSAPSPDPAAPRASIDTAPVETLLRKGQRDDALDLITSMRIAHPADPDLAALQANLYFEKSWWLDGVASFRVALRNDPKRAHDPALVGHVIRSLQSKRFQKTARAFLRELGDAARPFVAEAARNHDNAIVRNRAAALLETWGDAD